MAKRKRKSKERIRNFLTLGVGVTAAYFIWLSWSKLTDFIGDSLWVWGITGAIVLIAIITGYFSIDKIIKRFN